MREPPSIEERFTGCLLGAAVGDAIGFCLLSRSFHFNFDTGDLRREDVRDFRFFEAFGCPPGQFTDDTQMSLAVARTILRAGRICPDTLTSELMGIWQGEGCGPPDEVTSIIKGAFREDEGGPVPGAGNESAARGAAVGLWNWRHPEEIADESRAQSRITHADPRAAVGAGIVARAIALNVRGGARPIPAYLDALTPDPAEEGAEAFQVHLSQMLEWLRMREDLAIPEIARAGQEGSFGTSISPFVVPSVLISLYAFLRSPEDFADALAIVYRAGGDVNSTGAIAGALSGAHCGLRAIPERLARGVLSANDIEETARRLYEATEKRG